MMRRISVKKVNFLLVLCIMFVCFLIGLKVNAGQYSPEISGNYELGDRIYIDLQEGLQSGEDEMEEVIDVYSYDKLWLRYKQQLSPSDYYYIKIQYNDTEYRERTNYNNLSLDLWSNYTFRINEQISNKVMLDLRNKEYDYNLDNSYNQLRLKYQVNYKVNKQNDCSLYVQRQWKAYREGYEKDNVYDRISLSWDWDISDSLTVNSGLQFDWTKYDPISESSNKNGRKFDIGFRWKL